MSLVFWEVSSSLLLASVFCFLALNVIGFLTLGIVLCVKNFEQVFTFGKAPWLRTLPKVGFQLDTHHTHVLLAQALLFAMSLTLGLTPSMYN
jgi:hypothetical protein